MNSVNTDLRDRILLRAHYLSRFETGQVKDLLKTLEKAHTEVLNKIRTTPEIGPRGGTAARPRLEAMLKEIDAIYQEAVTKMSGQLELGLKDLSKVEAEWAAATMAKVIPVQVNLLTPSPAQVWAAVTTSPMDRGHLLSEFMDAYDAATRSKIRAAIRQGVVEGETVDQMVRRLAGTKLRKGADGVMQTSRNAAEALVRTGVMHVSNVAKGRVFKENSDLLGGVQWVATLDTRTCEECGPLDGKVWENPDDALQPPLHLNCRCTLVPVVKSWKELGFDLEEVPEGSRASMDGQVPESLTYAQWLHGQSPEVQNDALGPGRAALLRDGMSLDRFVKDGRTLTLDELKAT